MMKLFGIATTGLLSLTFANAQPACDTKFLELFKLRTSSMQKVSDHTIDTKELASACYQYGDDFVTAAKPLPRECSTAVPESDELKGKISEIKALYTEETQKEFPATAGEQYLAIRDYTQGSIRAKCDRRAQYLRGKK